MTLLGLKPLPLEGGYYTESYRSAEVIGPDVAGCRQGRRALSTAIFYLLTPDTCSRLHRLASDEIYHFYLGDPVELLQLLPDGTGRVVTLGPKVFDGMHLQAVVPRGLWQGARLRRGGRFALLGTTMAPGFDFSDCEMGDRQALLELIAVS
ncbi:MAG: cupin domain-containing protein [Nitrospirae bacterium]|nr:cupin domain-containing protein [Nitrospirota bacterium]